MSQKPSNVMTPLVPHGSRIEGQQQLSLTGDIMERPQGR